MTLRAPCERGSSVLQARLFALAILVITHPSADGLEETSCCFLKVSTASLSRLTPARVSSRRSTDASPFMAPRCSWSTAAASGRRAGPRDHCSRTLRASCTHPSMPPDFTRPVGFWAQVRKLTPVFPRPRRSNRAFPSSAASVGPAGGAMDPLRPSPEQDPACQVLSTACASRAPRCRHRSPEARDCSERAARPGAERPSLARRRSWRCTSGVLFSRGCSPGCGLGGRRPVVRRREPACQPAAGWCSHALVRSCGQGCGRRLRRVACVALEHREHSQSTSPSPAWVCQSCPVSASGSVPVSFVTSCPWRASTVCPALVSSCGCPVSLAVSRVSSARPVLWCPVSLKHAACRVSRVPCRRPVVVVESYVRRRAIT